MSSVVEHVVAEDITTLVTCCGVAEVGGFDLCTDADLLGDKLEDLCYDYGTGYFISTFVDTEFCRRAWEILVRDHKLLYQSPPRLNEPSHNMVFLCVFLHRDKLDNLPDL